ncbi:MAG TPA: translocation/assembly module TamB domain-containing protein [Prosthecobacter sp.]|nr:translocation/assembly module TamB domain-containing protein [Prosthecobacter sp.]HRK15607.1 translocation/assembly module TamB domain-containing protein [Prosthecobacter sp.]
MSESSASKSKPRRFWKWLRRFLVAGFLLLMLLAVFHKPLLLTVIRVAGPKLAAGQGLELDWQVGGTLWDAFALQKVEVIGRREHWLPAAKLEELRLGYDLRALWRGEHTRVVRQVRVHGLKATADLRRLPAKPAEVTEAPKEAGSQKPTALWPQELDIQDADLDLTLADGARLLVEGLTLQAGGGQPGIFECRALRREPGGPALENLRAKIEWETLRLTVADFQLPEDFLLERLVLDLAGLWCEEDEALAELRLRLGDATLELDAKVAGVLEPPMRVSAEVRLDGLRSDDVKAWGLPEHAGFAKASVQARVEGDPAAPGSMSVDVSVELEGVAAAGARVDDVKIHATVKDGKAALHEARVARGENVITITAGAVLPADPGDLPKTPWTAGLKASLPDARTFLDAAPPVQGSLTLTVNAAGKGPTPTSVEGVLTGTALAFEKWRLPELKAVFGMDGMEARVELPDLALGQGNVIALKSSMRMEDAMPVRAEWAVKIADAALALRTAGMELPAQEFGAVVESEGNAGFAVRDVEAGDFRALTAEASLRVREARHGQARLEEAALEMKAREGRVELETMKLRMDEENHLDLNGGMDLQAPHAFEAKGDVTLPALVRFNELLKSLGAPELKSGSVEAALDVKGQLQPWTCEGRAGLQARRLQTAAMPHAADASLEATFAGKRADLSKLEAGAGPWRLLARGVVDEKRADLAELKVWQKEALLLDGHARAPLDLMDTQEGEGGPLDVRLRAEKLRLHEVLAEAGIQNVPPGVLDAELALQGRLDTLMADIQARLADLKVPGAPKAFQPASVDFSGKLEAGRLGAKVIVAQPPLKDLTVEAALPVDVPALMKQPDALMKTPLQASASLPESGLDFLREYAPGMVRALPAKLRLDARVTGTAEKPLIEAALDVDAPEIIWAKPDLPSVRDVRARIRAKDRLVMIEDISAVLAGGTVRIGGRVDLQDAQKPAFDARLDAREALIYRDPGASLRADAAITCRGDLAAARVEGLVELVRGRIFKEIDLLPVLKLPADVPAVPPDTSRQEARLELPPALHGWTFDVGVRTRDPLLISGNLANGAVSADVRLGGTGAAPLLTGGANVDRLLLKLPFSMVKITKGAVTLRPERPFDPDLDIRGESRVGSNDITLFVYGHSTDPRTRFTSSPPMSEPDIVTLLATGTTLGGSAAELASEAASRAAVLFLTEMYRKMFNKKKVVREEPPRLHLTFNPSGADRGSDSVQATYDLTENWRLTNRFTQAGRMKTLLGYVLRFGKAARAVDEVKAP